MSKQPSQLIPSPLSSLFQGVNNYLVIILGVFVLIIIGLSVNIFFIKKGMAPAAQPKQTQQTATPQSKSVILPGIGATDVNANEVLFQEIKEAPDQEERVRISTKKYEGKVESINYYTNGDVLLEITIADIATFFDNSYNPITTPMKLGYSRSLAGKITVGYIQGLKTVPIAIESITNHIKAGDYVVVKETFSAKEAVFDKAVKEIVITKL